MYVPVNSFTYFDLKNEKYSPKMFFLFKWKLFLK